MRQIFITLFAGALLMPFTADALLMVSPNSIQFSPTRPGGPTQFRTARVTNFSQSNTGNVNVYNQCFGQVWVSDDCGLTLRPNESCNLQVQFTPNQSGTVWCNVRVESFPGGSDTLSIRATVN